MKNCSDEVKFVIGTAIVFFAMLVGVCLLVAGLV
jgi:hypothetical protein